MKTTRQKYGGRKPGIPNKITGELRQRIKQFMDDNWANFEAGYKKLEPFQQMQFIERLLPYCVPKLKETDMRIDFNTMNDEQLQQVVNELFKRFDDEN